jgi:hypothetical protein
MAFNLEDYEPVAHRLDRWLKDCHVRSVQPRVITDLVHYLQNSAVFSASLYEGDVLMATGWAEEVEAKPHQQSQLTWRTVRQALWARIG